MHLPPRYHCDPSQSPSGSDLDLSSLGRTQWCFVLYSILTSLSFIPTPGLAPSPSVHLKHSSVFLHILFSLLQSSLSNVVTGYSHISTPTLFSHTLNTHKINTLHWAHLKVNKYILTTFCFSLPSIQAYCTLNALIGQWPFYSNEHSENALSSATRRARTCWSVCHVR